MIGKTNSKQVVESAMEFVNVQLSTNQSSHQDILGAKVIVSYGTYTNEYAWNGDDVTFTVPAQVGYTVSFGDVEDYKTPSSVTFSAVEDNARTIEAVYETEIVGVDLSATDGSSLDGAVVTINGKSHTWEGTTLTEKVAYGTVYSVVAGALDGYVTPSAQTGITANSPSRSLSFSYVASSLTVNILSNQGTDAAIASVKATVRYGSTSVEVSSGQAVNIPSGSEVTISFPEVEGYKKPEDITFTHNGGVVTKSGTYQCELLTVNVSADSGSVSGFEVTISKQETVGVATKYTRLEYIESTGTQYIDTGFVPNNNTRLTMDVQLTSVPSGNIALFGASTATDSQFNVYYTGGAFVSDFGSSSSHLSFSISPVTTRLDIDHNKNVLTINGTTKNHTNTTFSSQYNLALLANNGANTVIWHVSARLYSCQIWDNGTMVRDYIPALRSDGIAGLYDAVNDTFYASSGSGNFLSGGESSEVIGTQTSITKTYKIPFDTSYTVQASKVSGYDTPKKVTRVASTKTHTVSQQYTVITVRDLSLYDIYGNPINRSTANCYVVREAGQYKFPLVYGNAIKNGLVNTAAFTNNGGTYSHDFVNGISGKITSPYIEGYSSNYGAIIANEDESGCVSNCEIVTEDDYRYVQFTVNNVPQVGANVVIRLMNGTSFFWSWHIWLWPHDLSPVEITNSTGVKYNIMPVNLASKYDSDGVHIKNWFYQWGRPNPMLLPSAWNSTTDHTPGSITKESKASSLALGLNNPSTFYYSSATPYNWFGIYSYYNLWDAACTGTGNSDNDTVKTVYDPCPVGWKIPNGNTFTGLSKISVANGIVKMARYSGDTTGVEFPLSGYRRASDGSLILVGSYGYVWLSSAYSQGYAYNLIFDSGNVNPRDNSGRVLGYSVRPVQDDNIQLEVIMISFTVNDGSKTTQCQAESGMTWFEWVNSSYNNVGIVIDADGYVYYADGEPVCLNNGNSVMFKDNIIGGHSYID